MQLRRHDLVWLSADGWADVVDRAADDAAQACLAHWFEHRLPLVVGRQVPHAGDVALGLAAPARWERRKLALEVPPHALLYRGGFPPAADVARLLPASARARGRDLCAQLAQLGTDARVHGSHGWQQLTGLEYLRARSDLDLHLKVVDADAADAVAKVLADESWPGPRLDGELLFPCGAAVAWREWVQWRSGRVDCVLVKRLHGVALERGAWLHRHEVVAA
jgi:phosphoribosyl-dephospho-CoA transferase